MREIARILHDTGPGKLPALSHIHEEFAMKDGAYRRTNMYLVFNRPLVGDAPLKPLKAPQTREAWMQTDFSKLMAKVLEEEFRKKKIQGITIEVEPYSAEGKGKLHVDPVRVNLTPLNPVGRKSLDELYRALGNTGIHVLTTQKDSHSSAIRAMRIGKR